MGAIRLIVRNSLREDGKKYAPFIVTIILAILLVSGAFAAKIAFLSLARGPLVRWSGGEITVLRSTQRPEFISTTYGLVARWSFMLFHKDDVSPVLDQYDINQQLYFGSWGEWNGQKIKLGLIGREMADRSPRPKLTQGSYPNLSKGAITTDGFIQVAVTNPPQGLRIGDHIRLVVPKIVPSGGAMNFMGLRELVEGIDYLDFEHGEEVTVQVTAIFVEPFASQWGVVMPLADLQRLASTDAITSITVRVPIATEESIAKLGYSIEEYLPGFYGLNASDTVSGMSADLEALERHADRLMLAVFIIATLMIASVLTLILAQRKHLSVQLMVMGFRRGELIATTLLEVLVTTTLGIFVGVAIPLLLTVFTSGFSAVKGLGLERFLIILPLVLVTAGALAHNLIPKHAQCLEVLRNE